MRLRCTSAASRIGLLLLLRPSESVPAFDSHANPLLEASSSRARHRLDAGALVPAVARVATHLMSQDYLTEDEVVKLIKKHLDGGGHRQAAAAAERERELDDSRCG